MSEDELMDDAPPQLTKRTTPGSSSNDDDHLKRLRMETRELLSKIESNESKLGDQMKVIRSKVTKDQHRVGRAGRGHNPSGTGLAYYEPSIEDKLVNTDIPYLFDNEIFEEFEHLSDEAWEKVKEKITRPIKDSFLLEDRSVEVDFKKLPDETKIAVMEIIHHDKKDGKRKRRQKVGTFLDKSVEEQLHILELCKNKTEERIVQLKHYIRYLEHPDLPKETDSSDSEAYEDRIGKLDRSTTFGRAEMGRTKRWHRF